jgi:hypothetical protein
LLPNNEASHAHAYNPLGGETVRGRPPPSGEEADMINRVNALSKKVEKALRKRVKKAGRQKARRDIKESL